LQSTIDVIVANPPYVATGDELPDEVRRWEPAGALMAGDDGLDSIAHILREAPRWLRGGGGVVVEIGADHRDAVLGLAGGYREAKVHDDLAGRPRVLVALS
jgi:release factor glutamine methyltransferase